MVNELGLSAGSAVAREMKKGPSGRTTPERKLMLRFIVPAPPGASSPASQAAGCVNLQERFWRRFKVRYEESYFAQYGPHATVVDPWYMIVPCEGGEIYPHGGDMLAAYLRAGPRAKALKALRCVEIKTVGSDGTTVLFHVANFDQVAEIMRPRKRRTRHVSPEERKSLMERLEKANHARGFAVQTHGASAESTIGAGVDI